MGMCCRALLIAICCSSKKLLWQTMLCFTQKAGKIVHPIWLHASGMHSPTPKTVVQVATAKLPLAWHFVLDKAAMRQHPLQRIPGSSTDFQTARHISTYSQKQGTMSRQSCTVHGISDLCNAQSEIKDSPAQGCFLRSQQEAAWHLQVCAQPLATVYSGQTDDGQRVWKRFVQQSAASAASAEHMNFQSCDQVGCPRDLIMTS